MKNLIKKLYREVIVAALLAVTIGYTIGKLIR